MKHKILIKLWKISSKFHNKLTKKLLTSGDKNTAKYLLNSTYGTMVYADTDSVMSRESEE